MKKILHFTGLAIIMSMTFVACSSDDDSNADPRDQYVGTWQASETGNITMYHSGQAIATTPINQTGTMNISKSGENGLNIDGKVFTLNGNSLTANPESISETEDGTNMVGTVIYSGQASSGIITINREYTGTWSHSSGESGNFSGSSVITLTK